ncbi:platelet glycoprotein VI [Urocitellus parryii]
MVALGGSVTLHCHLPSAYDVFLLSKGAEPALPAGSIQGGQGKFLLSPATRVHGGTYRCYGSVNTSLHEWSAPSNLLELMVTGVYKEPQLSAVQGPSGAPQHMTTLQCRSEMWFDLFLLSQEGSANVTQRLRSQYKRGFFQANFTLNASEQARGATYRCYGSLSSSPSLWSDPSEPLRLSGRGSASWNSYKVNMLRLSLGGVILLILLGFLVEAWLSRRDPLHCHTGPDQSHHHVRRGSRARTAPALGVSHEAPERPAGCEGPGPSLAMATGVSVLLGLVLFLHQRTQAQDGVPSIWAEPGSLVLHGSAVTIVCRIPPRVTQLRLYHVETKLWCDRDPQGAPEVAQFSLQQVKPNQAGTYHCEYWTEGRSSGHSDPLGLVVTGMHKEKPSLTAEPGPQVASGGQVTLLCHTTYSYEIFILCRDRAASLPQNCSHQNHSSFLMSPVTLAHRGTYRCYVSSRDRPRLWSLPSNPLELLVTGVPSIWAEPGPLVLHGSAVTIVCRIPPRVTQLRLYHVETKLWCDRDPQGAPEVAQFSLQQVTPNQAGTYHCEYRTEGRSSGQSDPLELVVTGEEEPRTLSPATYSAAHLAGPGMHKEKPSLTAEPGPQVASGGQVTLLCHTDSSYDFFILCRDRAASLPQTCSHQNHSSFLMSPVTLAHGGTYRCYFSSRDRPGLWSLPSDPLELLVTGLLPKPSLRALPSSLVPLERPVTIWCQGPPGVDLYRLEKLGSKKYEDQNFLSISAMKTSHAGRYRCSYQNGSQWSLPSDHLELVATGVFDKPLLTAHPSPVVPPGGDVTLKCQSQYGFDQFALYKEGDAGFYKRLEKLYLADFPMVPVTTAHSGTYRCYSFSNVSPYLWSSPSNPMVLTVTGPSVTPSQPPTEAASSETASPEASRRLITSPRNRASTTTTGLARQDHTQGNLVRICLGAVVLILLLGVVAEDWHSQRRAQRPRVKPVQRPLPPLPQTQHLRQNPGVAESKSQRV